MDTSSNHQTKILLIEDEPFISELYSRALAKAGYKVDWAADGQTGLYKAQTDAYDVILVDLMLPGISGIDILKKLHEEGTPKIKATIIVLTNLEYQGQNREKIERIVDGYLLKANATPKQLVEYLKNFGSK